MAIFHFIAYFLLQADNQHVYVSLMGVNSGIHGLWDSVGLMGTIYLRSLSVKYSGRPRQTDEG